MAMEVAALIKKAGMSQAAVSRAIKARGGKATPQAVVKWLREGTISSHNLRLLQQIARQPREVREPNSPDYVSSQYTRPDDETMSQAVELLYLLGDARPDDKRFRRLTWPMILLAAKAIEREAAGDQRAVITALLDEIERAI